MGIIKPLPKSVRSSVRAGVILYDATKVVEELVYNSLDAGASKISIFIGIGTSYVKVVDNGSGITRDGLALLGERYATSKFHDLIDMDTKGKTFGFRGEALASISDVSLLEIITKACGRANGYRKVIKGCKCLYLGIDDDMEDIGTTVIVRDLFYNQPVRRKHMQFSPKKVLQAVKKCVVRIALVHSKVSFKIVDSESESILLYTNPSPSPLSLLRSGFGSEVSRSLHELKIGDGGLKLSGYICSPFDTFTIKAVQYVYINRRFICKGQIHKLLNQLASRFVSLSPQTDQACHSRKRSRFQANPAYILNLDCPGSFYDLTFESSKTFVQFKDWTSILTFIEETIQQFWKEKYSSGKSLVHTTSIVGGDQLWKDEDNMISTNSDFREDVIRFPPESIRSLKKSRMRSPRASLIDLFSPSAMLTKDDDILSNSLHEKKACENSHTSSSELNDVHRQARMQFGNQAADHFSGLWGTPLAKCSTTAVQKGDRHPWVPDNIFVSEDSFLDRRLASPKRCDDIVEDNIFSSDLKGQSSKVYIDMINGSAESTPSSYFHEFSYDDNIFTGNKPSLRGCTSGSSFQLESTSILGDKLFIQNDVIKRIQKQGIPDDEVDVLKLDGYIQGSDFYAGDSFHAEFTEENMYSCHLDKHVQKFFSSYQTRNSPDVHVTPNPRLASEWDVDCFSVRDGVERNWRSRDRTPFRDLVDGEDKGCGFDSDIMLRSSKKNYIPSCIDSELIIDDVLDTREDLSTSLEKSNNFDHSSPVSPNMHSCQKGCGFDSDIMLRSSKKNYIPSCIDSELIIDDVLDTREDLSTSLEKSNNFDHSSPVSPNMHSCQKGCGFDSDIMLRSSKKNYIPSCIDSELIIDDVLDTREDLSTSLEKSNNFDHSSPVSPNMHSCQKYLFNWRLPGRDWEKAYGSSELKFGHQAFKQRYVSVERPRRCKSAPPSYKRKTSFYCLYQRKEEKHNAAGFYGLDQRKTDKFNATNFYCMDQGKEEKLRASAFLDSPPHLELGELRDSKHFSSTNNLYIKPSPLDDLSMGTRIDMTKTPAITGNNKEKQEGKISKQFQSDVKVTASALELCSKETQESDLWIKWKNCCPTTRNDGPRAFEDEVSILDISSGFLSLARNSLVPKSIDKNFLEDAKVLLQLDKKFIPVVSGGILAVIDQHTHAL
ncbi:DNA mismatch repair protein MLH3 isoform X2 [Cucurbita pepo subsp. pepo]|uniref:DNA mismatch repair protein MLH3 isoform X2 n=1 Tax=Cucurbita pepo subsp. pepo TaxID=3664 RepID=UPI000C9D4AE9|nr:DNA mismatch repair protein MLH3 isoform X2 [Cucurbita pepo subsp. pepo]